MLIYCRMILTILIATGLTTSFTKADDTIPHGKLPEGITPLHYSLDLEVFPAEERFSGEVSIQVNLVDATTKIWMHGRGLNSIETYVMLDDGSRVISKFEEIEETGISSVVTEKPVGPGKINIVIRYTAEFNNHLEGLFRVVKDSRAYAYTQFQPLRARMAFPSFDEPRFKTPFDISVTAHSEHTVVSNAPVKETIVIGENRKRVDFVSTLPLPTYLIALAVGEFDVVDWTPIPPNEVRKHAIPLRGISVKGKGKELEYALKHTAELVELLEKYFDRSYPFAKLDLVVPAELRSAGMENAGAIFYRADRFLINDTPSIWQLRNLASLHVHELAHSWFGNLVTPVWWDDLWLNEAFATWITNRELVAWRPDEFKKHDSVLTALSAVWADRLVSARKIRQPIENEGDISHAFDRITYRKGGGLLSMIEKYLGEEAFRTGVRHFINKHEYGVASADDFLAALSEATEEPGVIDAFRSFLDQAGTPLIESNLSCGTNGEIDLHLQQSRSLPLGSKGNSNRRWTIPLCIAYQKGSNRGEVCTLMREVSTTIRLPNNNCPGWIMPNAGGAAYVNFTLSEQGWKALVEQLHVLSPGEAISVIYSIRSAYQAGLIDTELLLGAAKVAAQSKHREVARAPMQMLSDLKNFYTPKHLRAKAVYRLSEIYRPALKRFDLSNATLAIEPGTNEEAKLRADLLWFMALVTEEPGLRTQLTQLAKEYLGYGPDNTSDETVLHPNILLISLIAAAGEEGLPFIDFLIDILRTTDDTVLRGHIIRALGYQTDPAVVKRLWKHIDDSNTPEWIASSLLRRLSHRVDNQETVFNWITSNYDALPDRLSKSRMKWLPWRSSSFCTTKDRDRVEAFYAERVKQHQGGERTLRNVLEYIEICAAVAQAQSEDVVNALTR